MNFYYSSVNLITHNILIFINLKVMITFIMDH